VKKLLAVQWLALLPFVCSILSPKASAEEGGTGHFLPGSMSSFIDSIPTSGSFFIRYDMAHYRGEMETNRALPNAGLTALNVDAESYINALTFLWRPPLDFGEKWSLAVSGTIPHISLKTSADVLIGAGKSIPIEDTIDGIGDILLLPLMLNYQFNENWSSSMWLGLYAPTGSYKTRRLANTCKNYWTVEPTLSFMYFGKENGR